MKIVIDIPEEQYELISNKIKSLRNEATHNNYPNKEFIPSGWVAIADGKVLPEGHGDLIDRSKLVFYRCKENIMDCPPNYDFTCQNCEYGWTCRLNIDEAPAVIEGDKE